jgi:hypothetical protein
VEGADPIALLRSRLRYFGALLVSLAQLLTAVGAANLGIAEGAQMEKALTSVHEERMRKTWTEKLRENQREGKTKEDHV